MEKINALLVDDEISAINTLKGMLQQYFPNVRVVAEAQSVSDALQKVKQYEPNLVFLDVEMPPFGSGFDFLEQSKDLHFGVIFVTAYQEYAVKAINATQPWAYLIKPININGLTTAIETAFEKVGQSELNIPETQSIIISDARKGSVVIRVRDIIYCKADGPTTDLFFEKNGEIARIKASGSLKEIEDQLPTFLFCRTHHSFLVNLLWVERYERTGRNGLVHLRHEETSPVSIGKMEAFEGKFDRFIHRR